MGGVDDGRRLAERVRRAPTFRRLPDAVLEALAGELRWRTVVRGEVLFHEGEPVRALFLLRSGRVKAVTYGPDGRELTFRILGPGELFPHVGLFDGGAYPATAEVLEDAEVGVLTRDAVLELAERDPRVALALVHDLERRVRELQERLRAMALLDLKARVLQVLMQHVGERLTHQEIASIVGAARESVSRVLSEFRRQQGVPPVRRAGHGAPARLRGRPGQDGGARP